MLLLYAPVLMMRAGEHNGQTWGKQIVGIRVVRDNGQAFDFGYAHCARSSSRGSCSAIASALILVIPWLLDMLWPLWDDENRALHDMIVSTHVVRSMRRSERLGGGRPRRSAAPVQIISSRAGPTPTITIGMPRSSLM